MWPNSQLPATTVTKWKHYNWVCVQNCDGRQKDVQMIAKELSLSKLSTHAILMGQWNVQKVCDKIGPKVLKLEEKYKIFALQSVERCWRYFSQPSNHRWKIEVCEFDLKLKFQSRHWKIKREGHSKKVRLSKSK